MFSSETSTIDNSFQTSTRVHSFKFYCMINSIFIQVVLTHALRILKLILIMQNIKNTVSSLI